MWEICLLVCVAFIVTILSVILLVHSSVCCISKSPIRFNTAYGQRGVLVVTAHPDDECMFFAPTVLMLQQLIDAEVHLLCLSSGKFEPIFLKEKMLLLQRTRKAKSSIKYHINIVYFYHALTSDTFHKINFNLTFL